MYKRHPGQFTDYIEDWAREYKDVIISDGVVKVYGYIPYEGKMNEGKDDENAYWIENKKEGWYHGIRLIKEDGEWKVYEMSFLTKTR